MSDGLTQEAFESTREFLPKHVNVLLQTQDARLGYALDSRYYGIGSFDDYLRGALAKLTLAEVNQAIRRHLKSNRMRAVIVTKEAKELLFPNFTCATKRNFIISIICKGQFITKCKQREIS